ncbi:MAG TPA: hypothetical protein VGP06_14990 [Janthinobacterium sp.]|jgi:hypothetical protein|nr:hypothetical protein [Janthinobacterium sp.]
MSISSISSSGAATVGSAYQPPATPASPIDNSKSSAAAIASAVNLSSNASIVSILGGGTGASATYSAAGLLNTINQAGTTAEPVVVPPVGLDTTGVAQLAADAGVVGTLSSSASESGVYTATGTLQNLSATVSANYANILKSNPGLTSTFVSASYNSGLVANIGA